MNKHSLPVMVALLLATPVAYAGDIACNQEGTQIELNACAAEDFEAADAELNQVWKALVAALKDQPVALQRLRAAQRAWIAFRDAEVAARLPVADGEDPRMVHGSMYGMVHAAVLAELTRGRTTQLRAYLAELEAL